MKRIYRKNEDGSFTEYQLLAELAEIIAVRFKLPHMDYWSDVIWFVLEGEVWHKENCKHMKKGKSKEKCF